MNKSATFFGFALVFLMTIGIAKAQETTPTLTWRVENPYIETESNTNYLVFDIELKASGNYSLYSIECIFNLNFDEDAFSIDSDEYVRVRKGMSAQPYGDSDWQYAPTINIQTVSGGHNLYIALTPGDGQHNYYEVEADTWAPFITIKAPISDSEVEAGLTFRLSQFNGNNSWEENQDAGGQFEDTAVNDFSDLYLSRIFSNNGSWTQYNGLDWSQTVNTSIWDGSATIDAPDAKMNHLHMHTFVDPDDGQVLSGLYIAPEADLTVEGEFTQDSPVVKEDEKAEKEATVLAKWDFEGTDNFPNDPYLADDGNDLNLGIAPFNLWEIDNAGIADGYGYNDSRAAYGRGWSLEDSGPGGDIDASHWFVELATSGYMNIELSSKLKHENGPNDYQIQYSLDGDNWFNVTNGDISVGDNWEIVSDLSLTDGLDDQEKVFIRWYFTGSENDEWAYIDDIIITGEPLPTYSGIHIASDETGTGSFIHNTPGTEAIVERYIPAPSGPNNSWDDGYGWHLLSSPVSNQIIDAFTVSPTTAYDFFLWDEENDLWRNEKGGNWNDHNTDFEGTTAGSNFAQGRGYLVAYENEQQNFSFAGELNVVSMTWSNLSQQGVGEDGVYEHGWHLLGNPFTSALNAGTMPTAWELDNVATTAKIWEEAAKAYLDVGYNLQNNVIPAAQGFFVQVSQDGNNTITIPSTERIHENNTWYKHDDVHGIFLTAREADKEHGQTNNILVQEGTTQEFNFHHDARFMAGHAPLFYSMFGQEKLSTKRIPKITNETVIQFGFEKNNASDFAIELDLENLYPDLDVFLVDKLDDKSVHLNKKPVYMFSSEAGDMENRFDLHFQTGEDDITNITSPEESDAAEAWMHESILYVTTPKNNTDIELFDINGRKLYHYETNAGMHTYHPDIPAGIYIVRITASNIIKNTKVVQK